MMKLHIYNNLEYTIEFVSGNKEYVLAPDDEIDIEVEYEDCMYLDQLTQG